MTAFDEGERVLQSLTEETREASYAADWNDLIRAFEIVDAARASARRRRAIDLHLETTSERNIFKSHMTAVGCLLLTFTLVGVVFLLLVMPLFDVRSRTQLEAQRADAIIRVTDFAPATATLNVKGTAHVRRIASRMEEGRFPVLIAEIKGADGLRLSERRRDAVIAQLKKEGVKDAAERTQVESIVGEWYPQRAAVRPRARLFALGPVSDLAGVRVADAAGNKVTDGGPGCRTITLGDYFGEFVWLVRCE